MNLLLYNTLTGKKEEFRPLEDNLVRMYHCGPTVYNYAHIGNLRAYVFADILRRTLEYNGYKVKQVINITDVGHLTSDADEGEDKMVKALRRLGKPMTLEGMKEVADFYIATFLQDLESLNIQPPSVMPRASDHITEDIELIQVLEQKGFAYKGSGGMYFDTAKFPDYGKLGNINLAGLKAGARVEVNSEKKSPIDFTLWKFSKPGLPAFPSPFGLGFPGWHIECSAMSRKYLDQPFDIHTGGIDHIPTHHQNELAQSEAAYGVPLAHFWMHNEHVIVPTGKMAKSGENFITLQTLKNRGIHALSYRYWLLTAHYRSPLNFSWEALEGAQTAFEKILNGVIELLESFEETSDGISEQNRLFKIKLNELMNDDLDTPVVLAFLNQILGRLTAPVEKTLINDFDKLLGLNLIQTGEKLKEIPIEIKNAAKERDTRRQHKEWKKADEMRNEIDSQGYRVYDPGVENLSGSSRVLKKLSLLV